MKTIREWPAYLQSQTFVVAVNWGFANKFLDRIDHLLQDSRLGKLGRKHLAALDCNNVLFQNNAKKHQNVPDLKE